MKCNVKKWNVLRVGLTLAGGILLSGCAAYQWGTDYPRQKAVPAIQETVQEIDTYRGDGQVRTLEHALSDDPTFTGMGDRVSTAALQFEGDICRIRLADVLLTTLKNNRAVEVQHQERTIAEEGIYAAKGIYDLLVKASYAYQWSHQQGNAYASADQDKFNLVTQKQESRTLDLSLEQLVPSGGVLSLFGQYGNVDSYADPTLLNPRPVDPYDRFTAGIGLMQPLLKNFGPYVTNAPIAMARIRRDIAEEEFRSEVIDQLVAAINTYWDLVFAIDNYEVQRLSLERAEELLRISVVKRDTGVEPPNVVLQAQAEVSRREALVIQARSVIADVADNLKRIMNIEEGTHEWQVNLIPVDRPRFGSLDLNEQAIYQEALLNRPDYRSMELGLHMAEIDEKVARNQKLPSLDAQVRYQYYGMGDSKGHAWDSMETGDYFGWNASLAFAYPLQNRQARHSHKQKEQTLEKQQEMLKQLEEIIRLEVRSAIRALQTNQNLIAAFEANVEAEEAKLDSQLKRYDVGFATIFEVLDFQEDLANAQVSYLEAVINFNKSMTNLQRVKASFLQDYRAEFLDKTVQEWQAAE